VINNDVNGDNTVEVSILVLNKSLLLIMHLFQG
jgi:hypothetical protein